MSHLRKRLNVFLSLSLTQPNQQRRNGKQKNFKLNFLGRPRIVLRGGGGGGGIGKKVAACLLAARVYFGFLHDANATSISFILISLLRCLVFVEGFVCGLDEGKTR